MEIKNYSKEIIQTLNIDLSNTIILAGAGISCEAPTSLPLGKELTDFYLSYTVGDKCRNEIQKKWNKVNKQIYKDFDLPFPFIRLEFIIGCIHEVDCEFDKTEKVLHGILNFKEAVPNQNHFYLSSLINNCGIKIITPNFDLCIEHSGVNDINSIYHFHGKGEPLDELGATIVRIKKGLEKNFSEYLKEHLTAGGNLICLGYSCSDFFDIMPFFDSLDENSFSGHGVFFEHSNMNYDKYLYKKASRILHCFKNKMYFYGNTSSFLNDLNCNGKISCTYTKNPKNLSNWKNGFPKKKPSQYLKAFYLVKLSNQMGITLNRKMTGGKSRYKFLYDLLCESKKICIADWIRTRFIDDYNKSVFNDLKHLSNKITIKGPLFKKKCSYLNEELKKSPQTKDVTKVSEGLSFDDIINRINEYQKNNRLFDTIEVYALVRHIKNHIQKYRNKHDLTCDYKKKSKSLLCAADIMLKQHFSLYSYMSYYLTILRCKWKLCKIVCGKFPEKDTIIEYFTIATEICAIDEIIKGYKYLGDIYFIDFHQTHNYKSLKKGIYYYIISEKLNIVI